MLCGAGAEQIEAFGRARDGFFLRALLSPGQDFVRASSANDPVPDACIVGLRNFGNVEPVIDLHATAIENYPPHKLNVPLVTTLGTRVI